MSYLSDQRSTPLGYRDPAWDEAGRVHDWRNYISNEVRAYWLRFSDDEKAMLARQAEACAEREEWE